MFLYGNEVTEIVLSKVNHNDYPRYVDAFVSAAKYVDGLTLNESELDTLTQKMHENGSMLEMCAELLMWE